MRYNKSNLPLLCKNLGEVVQQPEVTNSYLERTTAKNSLLDCTCNIDKGQICGKSTHVKVL